MEGPAGAPVILGLIGILVILSVVALGILATVIPFWKICTKAGFPGPLALLMIVPIANVVLPFYIAFAEWPALKQVKEPGNRI